MRQVDVAVVGGGMAGSVAAAMLARAGTGVVLIDPHSAYPVDFRCEKLDTSQLALLAKTGLADPVLQAATPDHHVWIARYGRVVEKRRHRQYGIAYDTMVNAVRAAVPPDVFLCAKATKIRTGPDRQEITLATGEVISARLVVLANGLNSALRETLGMMRDVLSPCHSISIGFDCAPRGRAAFMFPALTYNAERPSDRMAYFTLFSVGAGLRANLFTYRDMNDPWLRDMRHTPERALFGAMPGLRRLMGDFSVEGPVKIRPVDLYRTTNHRQPGIVLVGDAFATSCPAAGTGVNKVLTDVERLCHHHIPQWLASAGMGEGKIAAFYDDPVKVASDESSAAKAFRLRSLSTDVGLPWRARRLARFVGQFGIGAVRRATNQQLAAPFDNGAAAVGDAPGS